MWWRSSRPPSGRTVALGREAEPACLSGASGAPAALGAEAREPVPVHGDAPALRVDPVEPDDVPTDGPGDLRVSHAPIV
jgi:hypothetical protein